MAKDLTVKAIEALKPGKKRREEPDGHTRGLFVIVQPSGAKSWAVRYRIAGAPKKYTIGPYPEFDIPTARDLAREALVKAAKGIDPAAEKKAAREARKAEQSTVDRVESVIDAFVKNHHAKRSKPSWAKEAERLLRVEIAPAFGRKRLSEIKDVDVHRLLVGIAERSSVTARNTFAAFRKLCNWAMSLEGGKLITVSPCVGVTAPGEARARDRVLEDDESALVYRAFERIGPPFGSIGKLLILTGARRDEVAGMRWSELDLGARVWRLPKERTKNKRDHEIPLSHAAVRVIEGLPRIEGKAGLVFTTTGTTPVSGFSRAKAAIDKAILEIMREEAAAAGDDPAEVKPLEPWTLHDLRRTLATNLQKLGVRLEVTEAVLNHVSGSRAGIVGIYQRHTWAQEKREALDRWARRLEAIVSGEREAKVVAFAARK
jgi:integrase